jgi:hypothetical protein
VATPVADGIIDSFTRPGGQITGLTTLSRDLGGSAFELLTESGSATTHFQIMRILKRSFALLRTPAAPRAGNKRIFRGIFVAVQTDQGVVYDEDQRPPTNALSGRSELASGLDANENRQY